MLLGEGELFPDGGKQKMLLIETISAITSWEDCC